MNPFSDLPKRGRNHEVEELAIAALRHAWLKAERAYCRVWTRKQLMQEARYREVIRMGEREIHIGITLDTPTGRHDPTATTKVMVDKSEPRRLRNRAPEANLVHKVNSAVLAKLRPEAAVGLGLLLIRPTDPTVVDPGHRKFPLARVEI